MIHIGFTGTRYGMSVDQKREVIGLVSALNLATLGARLLKGERLTMHHGDCVGADADFHEIAESIGAPTVGHIPINMEHRAMCAVTEGRAPLPYLDRNREIVAAADIMIACPFDMTEQKRGGTWSTVGFTRRAKKPLAIVWPDGSVTRERWP